jgi:hypothetical protein
MDFKTTFMPSVSPNTNNDLINTTDTFSTIKTFFNLNTLLILIIIIASIYLLAYFNKSETSTNVNEEINAGIKEHMSAGTLTQLFAVDAQNKALNGDVDQLATGNYNLYWGQPSRVASTYPNRGQLLPATILPQVAAQQNGNNPNKLDINLNYNQTYSQQLDQKANKLINYLDNTEKKNYNSCLQQNCGENCYTNPQACGNGAGGYRLGSDFVEPTTAKPFISLQGNMYYPDEYVGSYWTAPIPDIMKPLPVIASGLYPLNNQLNST